MLTRRDLIIALISGSAAIGLFTAAENKPPAVMGSSVFDWNSIEVKTNANGSARKFFQAPTATLDELECHVTTLNPGMMPHPAHKHANEELIIIREGTVEVMENGEFKRVGPGSVIFNASNVMHSLRNVGDKPAVYHVISWYSPGMKPKQQGEAAASPQKDTPQKN
jgi:mannose-6-phosphate isomerase-like protein (cupin superfamily)